MKKKKVVILLSAMMLMSAGNYQLINAEDSERAEDVEAFISLEEDETVSDSPKDENSELFISDTDPESEEDGAFEKEFDPAAETEDDSIEVVPDDSHNLKFFSGSVERNDIFVGEDVAGTLKVSFSEGSQEAFLNVDDYTVTGYVKEEEYLNADHTLDNLNLFYPVPDSPGNWFLVVEGKMPYYGRLAVRIVVHDAYDLSMYEWMSDKEVLVGENPKDALQIFQKQDGEKQKLSQDAYTVLGYVTEAEYENAGEDLEKITEFLEQPDSAGRWLMVAEGIGSYHGKLAGWIQVASEKNLGSYECSLTKDRIRQEENIQDYIQISQVNGENGEVLTPNDYKVVGVVSEKEFASNGYDVNNMENIQVAADAKGGWYLIVEGVWPYSGKLAVWFEVS